MNDEVLKHWRPLDLLSIQPQFHSLVELTASLPIISLHLTYKTSDKSHKSANIYCSACDVYTHALSGTGHIRH